MNETKKRIANLLILVGVLAWLPYFFLLARGESPSILPFLAFHLGGVLSGGYLRSQDQTAKAKQHGQTRKRIARVLIILGVLAWAPYFYLTRIQGLDQAIGPFLAAHLTGVLTGSAVRLSLEVEKMLKKDGNGE